MAIIYYISNKEYGEPTNAIRNVARLTSTADPYNSRSDTWGGLLQNRFVDGGGNRNWSTSGMNRMDRNTIGFDSGKYMQLAKYRSPRLELTGLWQLWTKRNRNYKEGRC